MAEPVRHFGRILTHAMCCGMMLASLQSFAQELADPTRPPNATAPGSAGPMANSGPVLQSVLISPGRKVAVISGKEVPLHGRYGNAKVIRITETEVVLRQGKSLRKLKLFPAIEKRKAKPGQAQKNG